MVKVNKLHLMLTPMNDWCSGYRRWSVGVNSCKKFGMK